ncbi:Cytochrome P450, E-class, group I [Parasponia andersonii]|uniref:Cytochrome P450, E-class, group I n=1 Tax=Parasponia andersonii TaxID=3476 RepID=A0A2P5DGE4_PARAD|nr:Cytochrome P450, E-class, group I [Parasponia andersonii]
MLERKKLLDWFVGFRSLIYPRTVNYSKMLGLYANDVVCRLNLTGLKSRLVHMFKQVDNVVDQIISEHLDPSREKDKRSKDLVDVVLDVQRNESGEMPRTMDNVKVIILDTFAAGTVTTFITLDWGITELIMNPRAPKKAQAEIRSVLGEGRVALESDLTRLNYMKAIIKETYRLHPQIPVLCQENPSSMWSLTGTTFRPRQGSLSILGQWGETPKFGKAHKVLGQKDFCTVAVGAVLTNCPPVFKLLVPVLPTVHVSELLVLFLPTVHVSLLSQDAYNLTPD